MWSCMLQIYLFFSSITIMVLSHIYKQINTYLSHIKVRIITFKHYFSIFKYIAFSIMQIIQVYMENTHTHSLNRNFVHKRKSDYYYCILVTKTVKQNICCVDLRESHRSYHILLKESHILLIYKIMENEKSMIFSLCMKYILTFYFIVISLSYNFILWTGYNIPFLNFVKKFKYPQCLWLLLACLSKNN